MCRFSDAGNDDLNPRSGDRRPKSAKARNRVGRQYAGGTAGEQCRKRLWGFEEVGGADEVRARRVERCFGAIERTSRSVRVSAL